MRRAGREQELGPDRDHVGSHVGSAHDLESRLYPGSRALRDTNLHECLALRVLGPRFRPSRSPSIPPPRSVACEAVAGPLGSSESGRCEIKKSATSGSGRPLRGWPTTRRRATRRFMHAVRLAQKTSANRTGELQRAVRTCAYLRTAIATDPPLDKVMPYAQPVISDFAACSLPSLRGSQRSYGAALDIRSVIYWPTRRSRAAWTPLADGEFHASVKNAAGSSGSELSIIDKSGSPTQPHVRAFAFSWSNSAWVIVPASRSCLADAI
jgi:hypothetical protein